ncbi:MAG: (2Fe-2S)-binding protein [Deltaproteobacteria bacterium]|nr:(2Fe-2S)-binding protein [Deltaproteobacteria bacterium]
MDFSIDGKKVKAKKGEKILWAALDAGIEIPHLCAIREAENAWGACRLCFVEIEGRGVVTSCTEPVGEGMMVHTDTERVQRLRKRAMELILADHPMECKTCPKRGDCELLKWMKFLKVKVPKNLRPFPKERLEPDESHPLFVLDPNKCILCGKCIWVCKEKIRADVLDFAYRGYNMRISTFLGKPIAQSPCIGCGECVKVCPVGALYFKDKEEIKEV